MQALPKEMAVPLAKGDKAFVLRWIPVEPPITELAPLRCALTLNGLLSGAECASMRTACRRLELQHAVSHWLPLSHLSGCPAIREHRTGRPQELLLLPAGNQPSLAGKFCCPGNPGPWPCRERSSNTLMGSNPSIATAASRQSYAKGSKMTQEQRDALLQEVDRDLHR